MSDSSSKGYRDTLNLPRKTAFAMKANLVQREPRQRKAWEKSNIYGKIRQARSGKTPFILHDGPPYANGNIHMGHVINKVLKDIVVKYKTMAGFDAPFVPGWDCHGLPIESKVVAEFGEQIRDKSTIDVRRHCQKYAAKYVKLQSRQFRQLGIFGDFQNPYLTFKPAYEAGVLEVFAELVEKGLVYKQLKPIHWSVGCQTALAEAELEYKDISSSSIFVNMPVAAGSFGRLVELGLIETEYSEQAKICFMVWTTTPWTLAANLAVAVHPDLDYTSLTVNTEQQHFTSIIAVERIEAVIAAGNLKQGQYIVGKKTVKGRQLESLRYVHPFVEKNPTEKDAYMVICADYVSTEDGTGLVHIAPGHGIEDYIAGQKYDLAIYCPVDDRGCYDDTVAEWLRGRFVLEVDSAINKKLQEKGLLYAQEKIVHSYPHCWRSKMPVIFRATEQWFVSVDRPLPGLEKSLRQLTLESIKDVKWIPTWGQKRIEGMIESRPDWCISRQRNWGLPIPAFVNSEGQRLLTKESVLAVAGRIAEKGSDCWFTDSPRDILGDDFKLPDGLSFDDLQKEENIFDVWFESGCSWYSAMKKAGCSIPVDLYLEGSDQHRGWFQLSLLCAIGSLQQQPFRSVLTHGFTVDEKGMKQSKSIGNYVDAQDEAAKYGSDILRLWVASVNYQEDVRCTDELIGRTQDAYRKIRNTLRYLLSNTDDFNPGEDSIAYDKMMEIDQWAAEQLRKLITRVTEHYEQYAFHKVFSSIYNFCTVEMSNIYMDVLKDRLYCDAADSRSRRSAQTAMHRILDCLVRMLAPVLVHTAEEAWAAMKHKPQAVESIHLADFPKADPAINRENRQTKWEKLLQAREEVLRVLEGLRQQKTIASNQEAIVTIRCGDEQLFRLLSEFGLDQFAALCIVSKVKLEKNTAQTTVLAQKSPHQKCERCWNYRPGVGTDPLHPYLCRRCAGVVSSAS